MPRTKKQHLKQRSDGRFACQYDGRYFYGLTEEEAFAKRDAYKRDQLAFRSGVYIVEQYSAKWVAVYKAGLTDAAYNDHVRVLMRFSERYGQKLMTSIETSDIQDFYNTYNGKSQSSINHMRDTIRGVFRAAVADRIIQYDPTEKAILPHGEKGTHRSITQHERELIHRTQHRLRPMVMLMLYAGLRRGEALAINIERDIDFENRTITVREAIRFKKSQHPIIAPTKTAAGKRIVPLFQPLYDELINLSGNIAIPVKTKGKAVETHMTQTAFRRAWESYITALETEENGIRKRWYGKTKEQQFLSDLGELPEWRSIDIRSHDLRHSFATMIRDAGVDLKIAMRWMGHADQSMLLRVYDHPDEYRSNISIENVKKLLLNSQTDCQQNDGEAGNP